MLVLKRFEPFQMDKENENAAKSFYLDVVNFLKASKKSMGQYNFIYKYIWKSTTYKQDTIKYI